MPSWYTWHQFIILCVDIESTTPKKTRPITVLTVEELDALDDATFAQLAADEERLHQALQDPSTIRSGQALSIVKTKTRRQTVAQQRTLDEVLDQDLDAPQDHDQDLDPPGSDTGITSCLHKVRSYKATLPRCHPLEEQLTMMTRPPRLTRT